MLAFKRSIVYTIRMQRRYVQQFVTPSKVLEGDGVPVLRYFNQGTVAALDPFLMLDVIRLPATAKALDGFPWHPHAGQATFSYILHGRMEHQDSLGNHGAVGPGGVQYMVAANGIAHQEMPTLDQDGFWGFQLWINLDQKSRLNDPTYQNYVSEQIPAVTDQGVTLRVVSGTGGAVQNPCRDLRFLDVSIADKATWEYTIPTDYCTWILVLEGKLAIPDASGVRIRIADGQLVQLSPGETIHIHADHACRFLLVSALPVHEPVFWYGPFVACTREEMSKVMERYKSGAFGAER